MANVKITELTEIAATDVAAVDVVPIVDIDQDETKKVSISNVASANDFVTFTRLDANINVVSSNVDAVETRRSANNSLTFRDDAATDFTVSLGNTVTFAGNTAITTSVSTNRINVDFNINELTHNANAVSSDF